MKLLPTPAWRVFLVVFAVGLTWAAVTGQEWEDFYITYRASKNLAEGHGLVFTEGQRVHSFTSPLGVLLPAASYLLTGRASDVAALWIFRLMSLAALAGAAAIAWQTLRRIFPATAAPALLLVALVATDSKTLAFSTSGMETAFLLLFIAWALWAVFVRPARFALHLGLAWAGLMWTRPDSCVYVAGFGAGLLLFAPGEGGYLRARASWLRHVLLAGAVCTVVYLPWFAWAWSYYGTPVPHTITAKGLFNEFSASGLARSIVEFPLTVLAGKSSLTATFMPYYGGVPAGFGWAPPVSFTVALIPLVLFLLPAVRWEVRLASFVYATGQVYLTSVLRFPAPWYIPQAAFLGIVALALAVGQLLALAARWRETPGGPKRTAGRWLPRLAGALGLAVVAALSALSVAMAQQACLEMTIIERDTRAAIGRWLRAEAKSPRESVFLEPLGFIGYFSGLKMLDYPGLCSPEVVEARRRATNRSYPYCWSELILSLRPDWLVLRPFELREINGRDPLVLGELYERVKVFDSTDAINRARFVPLKGYLEYNGVFEIYRLRLRSATRPRPFQPILMPVALEQLAVRESPMPVEPAGNSLKAHAPSRLVLPVPAGASLFLGGLGIYEGAYAKPRPEATDGAEFLVEHVAPTGERTVLLQRMLDPSAVAGDRGLQQFDLDLPAPGGRIELTITAGPHGSNAYDWSYWYDLRFGIAP